MGRSHKTGTAWIAGFKILKGLILLTVSLGLLPLVHADIATFFSRLFETLRLDADSRILHGVILKIDALQPHDVLMASLVSMAFAAVLLTEGIGLWYQMSWAAYVAVVSTSLFIPFEIYELVAQVTVMRMLLLIVNLAIVWYLVAQLKHHTLRSRRRSVRSLAREETSA